MIARFQTYGSVLRFVSFIGDIDHIIKIKEIIDPKDSRRIKGWEVDHRPVWQRHILWAHDPNKALNREEADALREVIHKTFVVPAHLIRTPTPLRPSKGYSYTIPFPPGRDA